MSEPKRAKALNEALTSSRKAHRERADAAESLIDQAHEREVDAVLRAEKAEAEIKRRDKVLNDLWRDLTNPEFGLVDFNRAAGAILEDWFSTHAQAGEGS